ncbi:hypothetical protein [Corynebacterium halotolerans]|uniref:N-acetyltransferase domain-containing protein n=1 Tax=Corynebacterium halotolerans YIM 70093 = DSM 44683 TaxID=1121362 RepID=M1MY82_9CORY|nr:hypothetical protein [Corynebacterium halotolerans]AGF72689.1 hypothetical protein A605_08435 [Corynebacterium halotolerans YIM 70093 = DSM 44683]
MARFLQLDRPPAVATGEKIPPVPADAVRTFVFTANLAAQESSGDTASSVSVERVLHRLQGSSESDAVLLTLVDDAVAPLPATAGVSDLGYPLLPSVAGDSTREAETGPAEFLGFVHLSLPLLEDRHVIEFECVLDVGLLPIPGEELSGEGREVYGRLLDEVEAVARQLGRTTLQVWLMHPAGEQPGAGPLARELAARGFILGLAEIQGVLELPVPAPDETPLPEGVTCTVVHGYEVPGELTDGVLELMTAASTDIPHGGLDAERAVWTRERLRQAAVRLRGRGTENLMVVLHGVGGVLALTEFSRHPGSDPAVAEQGVTIVAPRARGRGLGRAVKVVGLERLRSAMPRVERVYTSNALANTGMRAVNADLGVRPISVSSAWQKVTAR